MGFGLLAAVCSTIKTIELRNLTQTNDTTFFIARLAFVTMIEAWIVLIVGCIPSLRPLMKALVKRLWDTPTTIPSKQSFQIYTEQQDKYGKYSNHTRSNHTGSNHTGLNGAGQSLKGGHPHAYYDPDSDTVELRETRKIGSQNSSDNEGYWSGNGSIVKTTDISVRFDSKAANEV